MKQHSVPQEIMAVEFNLFGAMTLRQFGYVAGAGGIGYFLYLIMPGFLKWPLAIICVLFGLALAFLPINDRPLDQYVTNFLIALRSPTRRVWRKTPEPPSFLIDTVEQIKKKGQQEKVAVAKKGRGVEGAGVFSGGEKEVEDKNKEEVEVEKEIDSLLRSIPKGASARSELPMEQKETKVDEGTKEVLHQKVAELKEEPKSAPSTMQGVSHLTTEPNVLNGEVVNANGEPITDAVVIVKDLKGKPVQAVRVNSKGVFLPKTKVSPGNYVVTVQSAQGNFEDKQIKVEEGVLTPLRFVSR